MAATLRLTALASLFASSLALSVNTTALAQDEAPLLSGPSVTETAPRNERPRKDRQSQRQRPLAKLMKELDVDEVQKTALRDLYRNYREAQREVRGPDQRGARGARGAQGTRGAKAGIDRQGQRRGAGGPKGEGRRHGMKQLTDEQRSEMQALRKKFVSDVHAMLDPAQQEIFDRHARDLLRPGRPGRGGEGRGRMLEQFDLNGDGTLDDAERAAMQEADAKRRERMLERFDANGDGELDETERETARGRRHAEMLETLDTNGDGVLSDEERREGRRVRRQSRR